MKKKALFVFISVLSTAILLAALSVLFPASVYNIKDRFFSLFTKGMPNEYNGSSEYYSFSELMADGKTTVNDGLMLINSSHPLPADYTATIGEYKESGVLTSPLLHDPYQKLSSDVYSLNNRKLYISSAYRTEQEQLDAIEEEGDVAANVGESEHQAGLAIDVYIKYYGGLAFLKTPEGRFVNTNCYKYGFIIRYPYYGEKITGITYEPWHLRFVGMPHAEIIEKNSITFEEYISL